MANFWKIIMPLPWVIIRTRYYYNYLGHNRAGPAVVAPLVELVVQLHILIRLKTNIGNCMVFYHVNITIKPLDYLNFCIKSYTCEYKRFFNVIVNYNFYIVFVSNTKCFPVLRSDQKPEHILCLRWYRVLLRPRFFFLIFGF